MSSNVSLEGRSLLKEDKDLNLVLQDEWVWLVRGQGRTFPQAGKIRVKVGKEGWLWTVLRN